jgi:hypothetical protein
MKYTLGLNGSSSFVTPPSCEIKWEGRRWAIDKGWKSITGFGTRKGLLFATVQLDKTKKDYTMEPHKTKKGYFSVWSSYINTKKSPRSARYIKGWKR